MSTTLKPGEIRISRRLDYGRGPIRYADMQLGEIDDALEFAVVKGEEILRETGRGARNLKVRVFETNRKISQLTLHFYTARTGNPHECSFPLQPNEIEKLIGFLEDVQRVHLPRGRLTVEPGALDHKRFTDDELLSAVRGKSDLIRHIMETEVTSSDIKAIAFRRASLARFERLLTDQDFFEEERKKVPNQSVERVWQEFFEANTWVFGYGLSYLFLSGVDEEKLEQYVAGYSIAWKGKEPDAVMKTRGAINALCLVEIKTHETKLLAAEPGRSAAYRLSAGLADAVSQSHANARAAALQLGESFKPVDKSGDPTSDVIYNMRPRSFIVAGQLSQFNTAHGPNVEKFASFEMFRRNLESPEIITYDELYERAKFIVEHVDQPADQP